MKQHVIEQPFSGEIVFWTVGDTNRSALVQNWPESLKEYLPAPVTDAAALKAALQGIYAEKRTLIRPLEVDGSYAVVAEEATENAVSYRTILTATIGAGGVQVNGGYQETRDIRVAFDVEQTKLPGIAVTKALVKVIEAAGGVSLRESGGVYWVPDPDTKIWKRIAEAVESAGILRDGPKTHDRPVKINPNKVYSILTPADERTARAVVDALISEVRSEIEHIDEEITATGDDALGNRALVNRASACQNIIGKVTRYESIFGTSLDDLRESLASMGAAAAAAALAGAPSEERGTGT